MFALEALAHVVDYAFHLYLGRSLDGSAFATFQSYSALALFAFTMAAMPQLPVALYTASPPQTPNGPVQSGAALRTYLWQGAATGVVAAALVLLASPWLAQATRVPASLMRMIAIAIPLAMVRPVLLGWLQGRRRFGRYGAVSLLHALARMAFVLVGIGLAGQGLLWAAGALPVALAAAVGLGLLFAGRELVSRGGLPWRLALQGWRLSLAAVTMAAAFMVLVGADVVWIGRAMPSGVAAAYIRSVVLRRVVSFVPALVGIMLFPRAAVAVRAGKSADRVLALALGLVIASGAALTGLYALYGGIIDALAFGAGAAPPTTWIASMAWAMTGYGIVALWISFFVATKPTPFCWALVVAALAQIGLYVWLGRTPEAAIWIFAAVGWIVALAGAGLYLFWLRPALDTRRDSG